MHVEDADESSSSVKTFDVFLSQSSHDAIKVLGIYHLLKGRGYSVYLDSVCDPHLNRAVRVLPLYVGDRTRLEQELPLLAEKHGLTWNNNPGEIAEALRKRLGHASGSSVATPFRKPHIPTLRIPITDVDRDRFQRTAFKEICGYFEHAKSEVEASQPRITIDLSHPDNEKLRCKLYLDGKSINECNIWIATLGRLGTINFFAGRSMFNEFNTSNEMISIDGSSGGIKLKGMMGSLAGHTIENATPEDAAAALWKWFVEPLDRQ